MSGVGENGTGCGVGGVPGNESGRSECGVRRRVWAEMWSKECGLVGDGGSGEGGGLGEMSKLGL